MEKSKPKIVITGVSGFLGSWILKMFVEDGSYSIRGTVRDPKNEKKMAPLKEILGDKYSSVEFFAADLTDRESMIKAVEGCVYVIHTASPFPPSNPKTEDEIIKPAVDGTNAICEACHKYKVKRMVMTSSTTAIYDYVNFKEEVTEDDWVELNSKVVAYTKSKTLAEKAAWDYQAGLKDDEKFEIVTINPTVIFGPILVKSPFATQDMMSGIMTGKVPFFPDMYLGFVDVRNVAEAHLLALTKSPPNQRFILCENTYPFSHVGDVLYKEFKKYGYKVTPGSKKLSHCMAKMFGCCSKELKQPLLQWGKRVHAKNDKSKKILGIKYRQIDETIVEMGYSLIENGYVKDLRKTEKK